LVNLILLEFNDLLWFEVQFREKDFIWEIQDSRSKTKDESHKTQDERYNDLEGKMFGSEKHLGQRNCLYQA